MPYPFPYYMPLRLNLSDGMALKGKSVNSIIVSEIYQFISQYYSNITLADYVMDNFSIDKSNIFGHDVSYENLNGKISIRPSNGAAAYRITALK